MSIEIEQRNGGWLERLVVAIGQGRAPRRVAGELALTLPSGRRISLGAPDGEPGAEIRLNSYKPVWASIRGAAVGFCESYVDGGWDSPDSAKVIGFYLKNRAALDRAGQRVFFRSLIDRALHVMRDNSRKGSKRNIEAHYDLGNEFYRLWLDETMTYSSAWFGAGAQSLADGQGAKYGLVLDALDLAPGQSLLEIGCGWGGLAEAAAARGAKATAITLSAAQLTYARARLEGRADFRLEDYRDTTGSYDRIASIEMIEAVGEAHWPRYFRTLADRLKPGGRAVIQAITIDARWFADYRSSADFIQRHIFPGGMLPTAAIIKDEARKAGLAFEPVMQFGQDYARTLAMWRARFETAWPQIAALGFDERFRRKWRLYLAYCEAGFRERAIDVGLYRFCRPA